ncbi:MAG: hypothetical protein K5765_06600 [Clostridia bacterium]|nr:hypothetical protein [Clostridia bacterium]
MEQSKTLRTLRFALYHRITIELTKGETYSGWLVPQPLDKTGFLLLFVENETERSIYFRVSNVKKAKFIDSDRYFYDVQKNRNDF